MAEITEQDRAKADDVLTLIVCGRHIEGAPQLVTFTYDGREIIARALADAREQARPPKGHVLTDDGVVRKVLGSLPVTADGCVVGVENDHHCADLWHLDDMPVFVRPEWKSFPGFSKCYSTRTAAESAHEAAGE